MKKIRLLLVDDHEMVRQGLRSILEEESDFEIVGETGEADRILELVRRHRPDIVLLDIRLPQVSGVEVCRKISHDFPASKVMILSTFMDDELVGECLKVGAQGYVVKDVGRFQLKESLRAVSRGEVVIDSKITTKVIQELREGRRDAEPARVELTPQQRTVLRLLAQGFSNKEIGSQMFLSENTVKGYVQDILQKMGVKNRVAAVMAAMKNGWL